MKNSKIYSALFLLLALTMLSSCLDSKKNEDAFTETQPLQNYYNIITDLNNGDSYNMSGVSYVVTINYMAATVSIKMSGLTLPGGITYPTLEFNNIPFIINEDNWLVAKAADIQPVSITGMSQVPFFNNFNFKMYYYTLSQTTAYPFTDFNFVVNNQYKVCSMATEYVSFALPKVTNSEGGVYEPSASEQQVFVFHLDPGKGTAKLTISGAKFASAMPAMNMRFSGISYKVSMDGDIEFNCTELTPSLLTGTGTSATEVPYPGFSIRSFHATYDPDKGMNVSFYCDMIKDGNVVNSYEVEASESFKTTKK